MPALRPPCLLIFCALLAGCASADPALYPARAGIARADLVVLDNHWHTGLVVRYADLPTPLRDDLTAFAGHRYLAVGWGDEGFYRASKITSGLIPQALFYSRGTVVLVLGLDAPPEEAFGRGIDVYRIPASRAGLGRAMDHLARSFRRDGAGRLIDAGPGLEGGRFYLGTGRYAWNHTCNQWTAAALKSAGLPITPAFAALSESLAAQIRTLPNVRLNGRPAERRNGFALPPGPMRGG